MNDQCKNRDGRQQITEDYRARINWRKKQSEEQRYSRRNQKHLPEPVSVEAVLDINQKQKVSSVALNKKQS
jgi:hypothetical protein